MNSARYLIDDLRYMRSEIALVCMLSYHMNYEYVYVRSSKNSLKPYSTQSGQSQLTLQLYLFITFHALSC